ncbi:MAG: hypothetical protein ACLU37_07200 [Collinsella sp.]
MVRRRVTDAQWGRLLRDYRAHLVECGHGHVFHRGFVTTAGAPACPYCAADRRVARDAGAGCVGVCDVCCVCRWVLWGWRRRCRGCVAGGRLRERRAMFARRRLLPARIWLTVRRSTSANVGCTI